MKKIFALLLSVVFVLSGCSKKEEITVEYDFEPVIEKSVNAIVENNTAPICDTVNGEWSVFDVARSEYTAPESWYEVYYNNLCNALVESNGKLTSTKHTTYSRVVIALSLLGKDVTDVAGYNLFDHFMDMEEITRQGIAAATYALIAFDTRDYEIPAGSSVTREALVDYLLEKEFPTGGWAIIGNEADVDITAQVLQALSNYTEREDVSAAVERALSLLSSRQTEEGGFYAWEGINSQSTAQVILALTSLGIDVRTDGRFIKEKGWTGSYIMEYYLGDGTFCHTLGKKSDPIATDQCIEALIAISRFDDGKTPIYDLSDIM